MGGFMQALAILGFHVLYMVENVVERLMLGAILCLYVKLRLQRK